MCYVSLLFCRHATAHTKHRCQQHRYWYWQYSLIVNEDLAQHIKSTIPAEHGRVTIVGIAHVHVFFVSCVTISNAVLL